MRKIVLTIAALGFLVVAYESTALGAGTATARAGEIRLISTDRCNLMFALKGFAPGTQGRLEVRIDGALHSLGFRVPPQGGMWDFKLHPYIGNPQAMVMVDFRIAADGMSHVLAGTVMVNCDCGNGGGGGGGGGGGNGEGGSTVSDPGAASAITSQPGFAG